MTSTAHRRTRPPVARRRVGIALLTASVVTASCTSSADESGADGPSVVADVSAGESVGLPDSAYMGDYELMDDDHGTVVSVTIDGDQRIVTANGLPNHEVGEFPNAGNPNTITEQAFEASIPLEPVFVGEATSLKEPGFTVAGVKFDPGTAERAECDGGTVFSIEALQDVVDLGLDLNNAHVQPSGAYHYHGESELLAEAVADSDADLVHVGFMYDGFPVYVSRGGAYTSSWVLQTDERVDTGCSWIDPSSGTEIAFDGAQPDGSFTEDWVYVDGAGDLDECNGTMIDGEYVYVVTDTFPYIGRCLMGEVAEGAGGAVPGEGAPGGDGPPPPPGP